MKFALISNVLPPSESAHALIIHRLLRELDPGSYCLISSRDYNSGEQPDYSGRLAGRYYYLPPAVSVTRGSILSRSAVSPPGRVIYRASEPIILGLRVILRARAIARILRREKCDAVVVCTGGNEALDFPAAYLASRLIGAPFYAYLLDTYSDMVSFVLAKSLLGKGFMQRLEPLIMKGAAALIAPNEFLRDELLRRFQREAVVIHNACDLSMYEGSQGDGGRRIDRSDNEIRIVYTGGVGLIHFAAFRNLVAALDLLAARNIQFGGKRARLHLYTAQSKAECDGEGIQGPVVYHQHERGTAMPTIQQQADVLFLPLALNSPYPEIARTAAPGKMGEFLAARRPILVHSPADSFISWYFRHYDCGLVVDQNDPARLAEALELLLTDASLRERLSERAWERAEIDFDLAKAQAQFAEVLGLGNVKCDTND
jgi:glycosyltransferase involved in cell wall biosynthesis